MPDIQIKELSERELEILRLVAKGASNKEIAQELFISANTVKVHLRNIFAKIGVVSRTEAAMFAVKKGIVVTNLPETISTEPPIDPVMSRVDSAGDVQPFSGISEQVKNIQITSDALAHDSKKIPILLKPLWIIVILISIVLISLSGLFIWWQGRLAPEVLSTQIIPTQTAHWQEKAPLSTGRYGLAVVAFENQVYAIGGETINGVSGLVECYDVNVDTWKTLANKPLPVSDINAAVIGGKIYVPGGRIDSRTVTDILEIFDPRLNVWTKAKPIPVGLSAYAIAAFEGKLYLFGGWDGKSYSASVYEYNPEQDEWSVRTPLPSARAWSSAAVAGGKIFIMGGYDGKNGFVSNDIYQPNRDVPGEKPWSTARDLPESRYAMGIASVADIILIFGGDGSLAGFPAYEYLPQKDEWLSLNNLDQLTRTRFGLVSIETQLFMIGGFTQGQPNAQNLVYQAIYTIAIPLVR